MKLTRTEILWLAKLLDQEAARNRSYIDGETTRVHRDVLRLQADAYGNMERKFEGLLLEGKDAQEFEVVCCQGGENKDETDQN